MCIMYIIGILFKNLTHILKEKQIKIYRIFETLELFLFILFP